jgi:hypothetical protein
MLPLLKIEENNKFDIAKQTLERCTHFSLEYLGMLSLSGLHSQAD